MLMNVHVLSIYNSTDWTVNGTWTTWGSWSSCSTTCGEGQEIRRRECTSPPPAHGGSNCSGPMFITRTCIPSNCGMWHIVLKIYLLFPLPDRCLSWSRDGEGSHLPVLSESLASESVVQESHKLKIYDHFHLFYIPYHYKV